MSVTDIKTPSITTLSIEVKVIKIGKKQCTLAVFRQLPTIEITHGLDHEITLNVWGHVIYNENKYVIAEEKGMLKKGLMPVPLPSKNTFEGFVSRYNFSTELMDEGLKPSWTNSWDGRINNKQVSIKGINRKGIIMDGYPVRNVINQLNSIYNSWENELKEIYEYSKEWNAFVELCKRSDQLFIAV